ncbi:MAG: hypothetical protein A2X34_06220 [Elusimicrobia bacterium GWC2_51_8]|nr:MAG: hypothetical protein A2X33_02945 [Elusimicrobia bacterium GWA2_51_34]OGR59312.1 MAG: hypothetical protein A2X34_06220 [Elusimicrobia bacterium GWC2_51_8]OGR86579.1 MAG: hypothetical protein A2021_06275 [Elusimicrobia bacterium GWF2_52_66]HAF95638.1 hypothetical protein [Elusimicrobiota bacterium]HCE97671.1 hypothetical protein [Elusimicrobiota bacterium]
MKTRALLAVIALAAACAGPQKKEISLTGEPSIERALDTLASVSEGRKLVDFLYKNPVRFEYLNTSRLCTRFSLKTGKILLPAEFRGSDTFLALTLGRAAYIYRLHAESGFEEIIAEEEEAAALFQARMGLELNLLNSDFAGKKFAGGIKTDFCIYILDGSRHAAQAARALALSPDADCQRPLETLRDQRVWLEKTRQAINDETFFQLLHDRDQQKIRKGLISQFEAMKNDANIRALPTAEIYRFQRALYSAQSDIFSRFEKAYREATQDDDAWRAANAGAIQRAREEFSTCNMKE